MSILHIENLSKSYDSGKNFALKNVSFSLEKGAICAIVGESGSGKTTLLRLIAGLETPEFGQIFINGQEVSSLTKLVAPQARNIGMVFQDFALFPHLTVTKNIAYGLPKELHHKVAKMLELVDLVGYGKRYPNQLSGGQQQRVALARALALSPSLLLLDEPFSNLDATLKMTLRKEVQQIVKKSGVSAIFITHDPLDAIAIADIVLFLKNAQLIEMGPLKSLYQSSTSPYVKNVFSQLKNSAEVVLETFQ